MSPDAMQRLYRRAAASRRRIGRMQFRIRCEYRRATGGIPVSIGRNVDVPKLLQFVADRHHLLPAVPSFVRCNYISISTYIDQPASLLLTKQPVGQARRLFTSQSIGCRAALPWNPGRLLAYTAEGASCVLWSARKCSLLGRYQRLHDALAECLPLPSESARLQPAIAAWKGWFWPLAISVLRGRRNDRLCSSTRSSAQDSNGRPRVHLHFS